MTDVLVHHHPFLKILLASELDASWERVGNAWFGHRTFVWVLMMFLLSGILKARCFNVILTFRFSS